MLGPICFGDFGELSDCRTALINPDFDVVDVGVGDAGGDVGEKELGDSSDSTSDPSGIERAAGGPFTLRFLSLASAALCTRT